METVCAAGRMQCFRVRDFRKASPRGDTPGLVHLTIAPDDLILVPHVVVGGLDLAHHAAYLANSAEMQDGVGANVTMVPVFRATGAARGGCRELELYGIGLRTKRAIHGTPERPVELFSCYVAADHVRGTDHHQVLPAAELHRKVRGLHGDVDELQFWADEERGDSDGPACVARLRRQMSCTRVRMPGSDRCWRCLKQQHQQRKGDARRYKHGVGRVRLAPGVKRKAPEPLPLDGDDHALACRALQHFRTLLVRKGRDPARLLARAKLRKGPRRRDKSPPPPLGAAQGLLTLGSRLLKERQKMGTTCVTSMTL